MAPILDIEYKTILGNYFFAQANTMYDDLNYAKRIQNSLCTLPFVQIIELIHNETKMVAAIERRAGNMGPPKKKKGKSNVHEAAKTVTGMRVKNGTVRSKPIPEPKPEESKVEQLAQVDAALKAVSKVDPKSTALISGVPANKQWTSADVEKMNKLLADMGISCNPSVSVSASSANTTPPPADLTQYQVLIMHIRGRLKDCRNYLLHSQAYYIALLTSHTTSQHRSNAALEHRQQHFCAQKAMLKHLEIMLANAPLDVKENMGDLLSEVIRSTELEGEVVAREMEEEKKRGEAERVRLEQGQEWEEQAWGWAIVAWVGVASILELDVGDEVDVMNGNGEEGS